MIRSYRSYPVLLAAAAGLAACSGGSSPNNTTGTDSASISVSLMDAPVDNVAQVNLVITAISAKKLGDEPPMDLPLTETPFETDLLTLTDEDPALLVNGALIEPGEYEWLRMEVDAELDQMVDDSHVITDNDELKELFVPSGRVQLIGGFDIGAGESIEFRFDWDLRSGLVHPRGLGGPDNESYLLKPTIRVIGTTLFDTLSGTVRMSTVTDSANECNLDNDVDDYDIGNVVYVYEGHDVIPDDIDEEADVTPLATVEAALNEAGTDYEYRTVLPEGRYTVAFSCQAGNDMPESNETGNGDPTLDTVSFLPAVNIEIDGEELGVVVDF